MRLRLVRPALTGCDWLCAEIWTVDVIEEPAPGVIAVTEIEETQITAGRDEPEKC